VLLHKSIHVGDLLAAKNVPLLELKVKTLLDRSMQGRLRPWIEIFQ
jgi:hypothetical protein